MASTAFKQFEQSFQITNRETLEGYDYHAFSELSGKEREEAVGLILEAIQEGDDRRAPLAVRALDLSETLPALKSAFPDLEGTVKIEAAITLNSFEQQEGMVKEVLLEVLKKGDREGRIFAASYLQSYYDPEVKEALFDALMDEERLVRSNAARSIFLGERLLDEAMGPDAPLGMVSLRLSSPLSLIREPAIAELRGVIEALKNGRSKEELGLIRYPLSEESQEMKAFRAAYIGDKKSLPDTFPYADIDRLTGRERENAKFILVHLMLEGDLRTIPALEKLDPDFAIEVFEEAVHEAPKSEVRMELALALWNLEEDESGIPFVKEMADADDPIERRYARHILRQLKDANAPLD